MAVKRTRRLPKPCDPEEAAKRLAKLRQQLENHIDEYKFERDQTGISFELGSKLINSSALTIRS
jgi:hypothetical protein